MRVQRRAVGQARLVLAEHALEAEQQRPGAAPACRGHLEAGVQLGERCVEREPARRSRGERVGRGLTLVQEAARGRTPPHGRYRSRMERKRPRRPSCGQPWWPDALSGEAEARNPAALRLGRPDIPGGSLGEPPRGCGPATCDEGYRTAVRSSRAMRTFVIFAVVIAVGAAVGIGLKQAGSSDGSGDDADGAEADRRSRPRPPSRGSPAPLAALHAQSNVLLGGGRKALQARLAALRGHPVVVNVWASWCGPCRTEMPALQRVALQRGRSVAFVGVNLKDNRGAARRFLRKRAADLPELRGPGRADLQRVRASRARRRPSSTTRRGARRSRTRARS